MKRLHNQILFLIPMVLLLEMCENWTCFLIHNAPRLRAVSNMRVGNTDCLNKLSAAGLLDCDSPC